jgi:membrane-associated phospholipid phosphatase
MHVGLATIFSWSLAFLVRPIWLKVPLFAYPLLMSYVVVASGNHYWIDGLFGVMVAAAAVAIAYALGRVHPDWAFHPPVAAGAEGDVPSAVRTAPA